MIPLKCKICKYRNTCQPMLEESFQLNKHQESIRKKLQRAERLRKLRERFKFLMLNDND